MFFFRYCLFLPYATFIQPTTFFAILSKFTVFSPFTVLVTGLLVIVVCSMAGVLAQVDPVAQKLICVCEKTNSSAHHLQYIYLKYFCSLALWLFMSNNQRAQMYQVF